MPTPQGSFYVFNDIFRLNYAWSQNGHSKSNVVIMSRIKPLSWYLFISRHFKWRLGFLVGFVYCYIVPKVMDCYIVVGLIGKGTLLDYCLKKLVLEISKHSTENWVQNSWFNVSDLAFNNFRLLLIKYPWWPGGGGLGLVGLLPMRSQVRIRSGANNSLGPSDLGEAHEWPVVHLRGFPCRGPVHPRD